MKTGDLILRRLLGVPEIEQGDDLARIAVAAMTDADDSFRDSDVLVIAQKVVSKAEGRVVDLDLVKPSPRAVELSKKTGKDPRLVELILRESNDVLRHRPGLLVVEHRLGFVLANAGIDRSNVGGGDRVLLLPIDPDASAQRIRRNIETLTGKDVGVVIIDSIGRAWRQGTIGTAIGSSGIPTLLDLRGRPDRFGRPLETTEIGFADELAAAASLIMGQANEGTPLVLARGLSFGACADRASALLRPKDKDVFR